MTLSNWDPLDETTLPKELYGVTLKRQIKNILKSYTGWFDPLSELIQNALDAVEKSVDKRPPTIWVEINLQDNSICVTDNGVGFSEDQFKSSLAPNVSFKEQNDRGNKGVGATYLGYGFNFLQIGTTTPDFTFVGTIKAGREWVEDAIGTKTKPKIHQSEPIHNVFRTIDRGSTFCLKLTGEHIYPKNLKWVGATKAEQWEVVLRFKTPLGGLYFTRKSLEVRCNLRVVDENGEITEKRIDECEYLFPHKVISICKDLNSITKTQQDLIAKRKDGSRLPANFLKLNGLYNSWTTEDIINDDAEFATSLTLEQKELAKKYRPSFYGFLCYSTNIWDRYNDDVIGLRKGARILRGGLQLSTNYMPQGDVLVIPLSRQTYYQDVTHVVVHFEQADPDLGRKGFQPELQVLALDLAEAVVKKFLPWTKLLKKETGAPPDIVAEKAIYDWIKEQEEHEKNNPLKIRREDVFLPTKEPSITSKPLNEQDVIALFNQLLAGGVIRGLRLMATNQHQQYDGLFRFFLKKPLENHIFNKEKNPLGIEKSKVSKEFDSAPHILEYKYSFDGLIDEIEKEVKNERQIELVIAWEMGKNWMKRYEITPLLYLDNIQHRYFHGGTHIVSNSSTGDRVFSLIILSELIDYINDPDSVQEFQKSRYIESAIYS